jgi:GAF domain-containing protein
MIHSDSKPEILVNEKRPSPYSFDDLKITLLQNYLSGSIILGTIVFFINLFVAIQTQNYFSAILVSLLFVFLFVITFVRRIHPFIRSLILSILYIGAGILSIVSTGINANAVLYFFISILLLGILLPRLWWVAGLIFEGILISLIGLFIQIKWIQLNPFFASSNSLANWFSTITITLFLAFVTISPLYQYLVNLRSQKSALEDDRILQKQNSEFLSEKVLALETEVDRRRSKTIAARQVAREISQQNSLRRMLNDTVDLICSQFGFYHSGIFLSDDRNEYAVLRAASGEAGRRLLNQNHKLRIREEGIIGYVVAKGETRLALDVGEDSVHFKNPVLPDTRSEVGIPLKVGTSTIGALDIQSDKESAFTEEDIDILQSIADQLASSISKTIQIENLETQNKELQSGYGEFTRGIWRSHLQGSKKNLAFRYMGNRLLAGDSTKSIADFSSSSDETPNEEINPESADQINSVYSVPIKLRDQILGVINIRYDGKKVPVRLINLVNTATTRLAVALENARLLENIQERAEREHTVSEISSRVRSSQTVESIMQTAISELGKTLGVNEVSIQLKTTNNTDQQ